MIWTILHIIEITLWIIISFSVFYVAFFAVISSNFSFRNIHHPIIR